MRKGFVERMILHILNDEGPLHTYGIIKAFRKLTLDIYSPSPGAVYPAIKRLLRKNLIYESEGKGGRIYVITEKGKTAISLDESISDHIEKLSKSKFPFKELSNIAKLIYGKWDDMDDKRRGEISRRLSEFYNEMSTYIKNEESMENN